MAIEYVVKGHVRNKDGTAVTRPTVLLSDRDLRSEVQLGSARANDEGFFEVSYSAERFEWAEARKGAADLSFQVLDHEQEPFEAVSVFRILAEERVLIEDPPVIFNAGPEEVVDLVIGGGDLLGASEYELLLEELKPVLHGMSPADLTENDEHQDVTFLSKELSVDPERILFLIVAHRLARETEL